MKKFGFATILASGLAAAVLGLAAPACRAPVRRDHRDLAERHPSAPERAAGGHRRAAEPLSHDDTTKGHPTAGAPFLLRSCYPAIAVMPIRAPA